MPVVYSLYDPKGLTSLRIHLSYQSILFQLCLYNPLSIKSPYITTLGLPFVTDLINQVSQLLRAELKELVDEAQATIEPIEPCNEDW